MISVAQKGSIMKKDEENKFFFGIIFKMVILLGKNCLLFGWVVVGGKDKKYIIYLFTKLFLANCSLKNFE